MYKLAKSLLLIILLQFHTFAFASFFDEIQVYDGEITKQGEFGLELHLNTTITGNSTPQFPNQRVSERGVRFTPEFKYGLTNTIELGFYTPFIYTPEYGYETAGYKPRIKWMPIQGSETQPFSFGLNVEYSVFNDGMEIPRKGLEYKFIGAWDKDKWSFAGNAMFSTALSDGQDRNPNFYFSLRGIYHLNEEITGMGLEYYQGVGPIGSMATPEDRGSQLFAVVELNPKSGFMSQFDWHIGVGYGWNTADMFTIKMIVSPRF